jgi:hypothetical protein
MTTIFLALFCCISGVPSTDQLTALSKQISSRWKSVARVMLPSRISENEIEEITRKHPESISEQCIAMLVSWQFLHGSKGTIECLVTALNKAGCKLASEIVFGIREGDSDELMDTGCCETGIAIRSP